MCWCGLLKREDRARSSLANRPQELVSRVVSDPRRESGAVPVHRQASTKRPPRGDRGRLELGRLPPVVAEALRPSSGAEVDVWQNPHGGPACWRHHPSVLERGCASSPGGHLVVNSGGVPDKEDVEPWRQSQYHSRAARETVRADRVGSRQPTSLSAEIFAAGRTKCHARMSLGRFRPENSPNCSAFLEDADELVKRICLSSILLNLLRENVKKRLAERVGFEPTCRLRDNTLSRRARYDHFGTSPQRRDGPLGSHIATNRGNPNVKPDREHRLIPAATWFPACEPGGAGPLGLESWRLFRPQLPCADSAYRTWKVR